ncbi:hypothetical protein [Streptomyces sp. NPDC058297]|uniref:hypothetical protein n=1 Tax=Streptomyces sp. NPDC058297 TaxID=3346433 RepID=UPI0036EB91B7
MTMRRGWFGSIAVVRRHLAGGLLLVVTALAVMMLLAPRVGAAPGNPTPTPSPSASFPKYEPGLEPTAPGLLPPESVHPTAPKDKDKTGGTAKDDKKKDAGQDQTGTSKKPSAREKNAAAQEKLRREMRQRVKEYKAKHGEAASSTRSRSPTRRACRYRRTGSSPPPAASLISRARSNNWPRNSCSS